MDSMRSLDTSLPRTRRRRQQANNEVLQAFKAAALSVTQLYKSASADVEAARVSGYQDALEDILGFLDQENIGLDDGEGWRVRQWATERLSPSSYAFASDAEDDDREERPRTTSPTASASATSQQKSSQSTQSQDQRQRQNQSAPPAESSQSQTQPASADTKSNIPEPSKSQFTFQSSGPAMPDIDMTSLDPTPPVRVDVLPRAARNGSSRHNALNGRSQTPTFSIGPLGHGSGSKRKQNLGDFFDFGEIHGKDPFFGGGGGKKARFT